GLDRAQSVSTQSALAKCFFIVMKKESLIGQPAAYLSMDCNEGGFGAPRPPQYGGRDGLNPDARRANGFRNLFSKDCSSPASCPLSFLSKRVKTTSEILPLKASGECPADWFVNVSNHGRLAV